MSLSKNAYMKQSGAVEVCWAHNPFDQLALFTAVP